MRGVGGAAPTLSTMDRVTFDCQPAGAGRSMRGRRELAGLCTAARVFSPYDLNPGGANPLKDVLAETVDFARLARAPIKLFVTATNVHTGQGRVFRNAEVTPDVLLAHPGDCEGALWARMRVHRISGAEIAAFGSSSKVNAEWDFLRLLRDEGRRAAGAFLAAHSGSLGRRSTLDLDALLAGV